MTRWLIRAALLLVLAVPLVLAAQSPLLAWRSPVYIAAGFAGIAAMGLLLLQPLLAAGLLPDLTGPTARRVHRLTGIVLVSLVIVHVAALWLTSPPDVVDALLLRSPTPFSVWGVLSLAAILVSAALVLLRPRRIGPRISHLVHRSLAAVIVAATILHALLIEGTMEQTSKVALSVLVAAAACIALMKSRPSRR